MKDFLGSDRFGFERVIMQILAPGLVALGPFVWLVYLLHREDVLEVIGSEGPAWIKSWADANGDGIADPRPLMDFVRENKTLAITVVMLCAVLVGLVIEDAGAWVERNIIDPFNHRRVDINLGVVWQAYLRAVEKQDSKPAVAPKYMSAVLPRMKFQLSLGIALLIFCLGFSVLTSYSLLKLAPQVFWVVLCAMLVGALLQFFKARSYCRFLHELRVNDLQARGKAPERYFTPEPIAGSEREIKKFEPIDPDEAWSILWAFEGFSTLDNEFYRVRPVRITEKADAVNGKSRLQRARHNIKRLWIGWTYRCLSSSKPRYISAELIRPIDS